MRAILITATLVLCAGQAAAQTKATVTTNASVTVMDPAQISAGAPLSVDPVARPQSGSKAATGQAGSYTLVGQGGETFNVSVPSSVKLTRSGSTEEIELSIKTDRASGAFTGPGGTVSTTTVGVQATAPVTSTATAGVYQGELPVTLTYQ